MTSPIHSILRERYSPRAFSDRAIDPDTLARLFEAARWAPSSFNEQPWRFIVTRRGTDAFESLAASLTANNQRWAPRAPVLMLSVAATRFHKSGEPNRHAWHDVGAAMANLTTQATSEGLAVHQMAGFDAARAREAFRIPAGFEPVAAAAIGYPGSADSLPDDLAAREQAPRERRALAKTVHHDRWG